MNVYLDTSVVLRILCSEPDPIQIWGEWDRAFSSNLWRIEASRTVDRLRLSGMVTDTDVADLVNDIQMVNESLWVHPLAETILKRAGESFPTILGTLDALHLSTALSIRENETIDLFLTHDRQLGTAARSLGFEVMGIET